MTNKTNNDKTTTQLESKHRLDILISEREIFISMLSNFEEEIFSIMEEETLKSTSRNMKNNKVPLTPSPPSPKRKSPSTRQHTFLSPTHGSHKQTIADEELYWAQFTSAAYHLISRFLSVWYHPCLDFIELVFGF